MALVLGEDGDEEDMAERHAAKVEVREWAGNSQSANTTIS
jgi:hypothetical protein